jgi:hypothetical protein
MTIRIMMLAIITCLGASSFAHADDRWFEKHWKQPHAKGKQQQYSEADASQAMHTACVIGQVISFVAPAASLACLPSQLEQLGQLGQPQGRAPATRTVVVHSYDKKTQKLVRREIQIATNDIRDELRKEFRQELAQAIAGIKQEVIIVEEQRVPSASVAPLPKAEAEKDASSTPKAAPVPKAETPPARDPQRRSSDPNIEHAVLMQSTKASQPKVEVTPVALAPRAAPARSAGVEAPPAPKRHRERGEMKFLTD